MICATEAANLVSHFGNAFESTLDIFESVRCRWYLVLGVQLMLYW